MAGEEGKLAGDDAKMAGEDGQRGGRQRSRTRDAVRERRNPKFGVEDLRLLCPSAVLIHISHFNFFFFLKMRVRGSGQRVNVFVQSRPSLAAGTLILRVGSGQAKKKLSRPSILRVGSGRVGRVPDPLIRSNYNRTLYRRSFLGIWLRYLDM